MNLYKSFATVWIVLGGAGIFNHFGMGMLPPLNAAIIMITVGVLLFVVSDVIYDQ